ncbi:hypothetical protein ABW286_20400 [Erwinia papayae]|uniref:Uncharacterized protein n=1 Tax=Erwinia papayae TaxID=206499 RepID=A0ABV3N6R4_9GAMM
MKKTIAISSLLMFFFSVFCCFAADVAPDLSYDKNAQVIKSSDGAISIKFEERDEGNSSYYFDYFGGLPSIVHDNDSLNSYSVYSIIDSNKREPDIKCIYIDFKSGNNGVVSKEGRCGLDLKGVGHLTFSGDEGDDIVNNAIEKNNDINTSYFINGRVKYLPIMMFQSKTQYVYKLYETSKNLSDGSYKIISCSNDGDACEVYSNNTWVVFNDAAGMNATFESIKKINGNSIIGKAFPDEMSDNVKKYLSFNIKSSKSYLHSSSGEKLKSYLIQGDKVTLLKIDNGICSIRYINSKNKSLDGNVTCGDLNLYN